MTPSCRMPYTYTVMYVNCFSMKLEKKNRMYEQAIRKMLFCVKTLYMICIIGDIKCIFDYGVMNKSLKTSILM